MKTEYLICIIVVIFQKSLVTTKSKSSNSLVRTVSSPAIIKKEITIDRTRTVSLDGIDIDEEEVFSQWSSSSDSTTAQTLSNNPDSKSLWKQIFSKPVQTKSVDDDLKAQWSELDKNQSSDHYRFNKPAPGVKRTCPFYKKIPGRMNCLFSIETLLEYFFRYNIRC